MRRVGRDALDGEKFEQSLKGFAAPLGETIEHAV
jgi:hypothetical protein